MTEQADNKAKAIACLRDNIGRGRSSSAIVSATRENINALVDFDENSTGMLDRRDGWIIDLKKTLTLIIVFESSQKFTDQRLEIEVTDQR